MVSWSAWEWGALRSGVTPFYPLREWTKHGESRFFRHPNRAATSVTVAPSLITASTA